ncbi:MAG: 16S rRNA (cytosine(967)-C(5))-methyltransferase RsmB [Pseudomonadales bacterium]
MPPSRAVAAQIIGNILQHKGSLSVLLPQHTAGLPPTDVAFTKELCFGVLRWYFQLHAALQSLLAKPLRKKDLDVYALLLIGAYQLSHLRTPAHAALSQTVEACRTVDKSWATGLVNGVMRKYERNQATLFDTLTVNEQLAHPSWLSERIKRAWPQDNEAILRANNERPPLTLRINRLRGSREDYLRELEGLNVKAHPCRYASQAIIVEEAVNVQALPGFANGRVSVQDEGAQLAAPLLDLQRSQSVLDACAAPGGKTCHMLELQPELQLLSIDIKPQRLARVQENLDRLQLKAQLLAANLAEPESWRRGEHEGKLFDRILLDVPCSATGVIRRHPDIKFLRQDKDIEPLTQTQCKLLQVAWNLLKPGGKLLYSTCSILPDENEQIIEAFIAQATDASHETIQAPWGRACHYGRQLLPTVDAYDGFFYALLNKTQNVTL